MTSALVQTKLYVPRVRRRLVARPRLSERLRRGAAARLTLVSAPAGFGKTTLPGLIAGPILCIGGIAVLFGVIEPDSPLKALAAGPEFVRELSLGIYLTVKGFKSSGLERLRLGRAVAPVAETVQA
jgi:hypothetical protein